MHRECRECFSRHRLQRKPLVSDPGMHHGTCVTHVPLRMSGSLTCGGGENVAGIPGACATTILHICQGQFESSISRLGELCLILWPQSFPSIRYGILYSLYVSCQLRYCYWTIKNMLNRLIVMHTTPIIRPFFSNRYICIVDLVLGTNSWRLVKSLLP